MLSEESLQGLVLSDSGSVNVWVRMSVCTGPRSGGPALKQMTFDVDFLFC